MLLFLLFGILPEVLCFHSFVTNAKGLKEKRFISFVAFLFVYLATKFIFRYSVYFNLSCLFGFYLVLKIIYKDKVQITDVFLMSFVSLLIAVLSATTYFLIKDYNLSIVVNRILIFILICNSKNCKYFYENYIKVWNRNRENPNKIKSLTVRNMSVITFNLMVFVINILLQYMLQEFN